MQYWEKSLMEFIYFLNISKIFINIDIVHNLQVDGEKNTLVYMKTDGLTGWWTSIEEYVDSSSAGTCL